MLNSNPVLDFKTFDPKLPYLGKFDPKIENASFFMKIGTQLNLRVLISNPAPILIISTVNYPIWSYLVQKLEMLHFPRKLIPKPI